MYVFIIIRENAISKKLKTEIMQKKNLQARKKTQNSGRYKLYFA